MWVAHATPTKTRVGGTRVRNSYLDTARSCRREDSGKTHATILWTVYPCQSAFELRTRSCKRLVKFAHRLNSTHNVIRGATSLEYFYEEACTMRKGRDDSPSNPVLEWVCAFFLFAGLRAPVEHHTVLQHATRPGCRELPPAFLLRVVLWVLREWERAAEVRMCSTEDTAEICTWRPFRWSAFAVAAICRSVDSRKFHFKSKLRFP